MLRFHLLKKFLALANQERRLVLRAFVDLARVDLALRFFGSQRVLARAWSVKTPATASADWSTMDHARHYARFVEMASRHHVIPARCLHCSLVLHRWLQREHIPSSLRIGVRKVAGRMQAHAWVEVGDQVVSDAGARVSTFIPLSSPLSRPLIWKPVADSRFARYASGLETERL